jgi:hypothetical protein
MYTHENFTADVVKNFEFLETEHGMRREPGGSSWVAYANPVAKVIIEHEGGSYCGVTVVNLRHVKKDPLERSEFDLEEIVAISGNRPPRKQDPRSVTEAIARAAETLRAAGASVLKGDFDALHTRQKKLVEANRRHNPLE